MYRTGSFNLVNRSFEPDNNKYPKLRGSVGSDLQGLEQDRAIKTDPGEARRRRTIKLHRTRGQSWGFTLQTYGIRNKRTREVEIMSYVDYVEVDGSAWVAGMRRGDIILSVNGDSVEFCTHRDLVRKIQSCTWELRLVVLFEDCCQKVELHQRYLRLKRLLSQKMKELRELEAEEKKINQGIPLSRCDSFRQSSYSSTSSDWDIYSEITSPSLFDCVPVNRFAFRDNCSQSVSDISTESSVDSLGSVSSFTPKGEEDCLFLKSSYITDGESQTAGSKFTATRDNNCLRSTLAEDNSLSSSKIPEQEDNSRSSSKIPEQEDSSLSSSKIPEQEDCISPKSTLAEHEGVAWFIEDDDRLSTFIHNNDSRFSCVQLEDKLQHNQHLQCSFEQESSHEEIEGRQRCLLHGLEQMDNNEVGCRHTFHGSPDVDCVVQGGNDLPEMSQCLSVGHTPSPLTPASSHLTGTSCRHEEDLCLVSVADLQAGNVSSQRLAAMPDMSDMAETAHSFNHQDLFALPQSEAEDYARFEQGRERFVGLTCGSTASCHTETSSCCSTTSTQANTFSGVVCPDLGLSLDAEFCDACQRDLVNCACSNTKCQDISDSTTKCQDISDSNTKCQDISDSTTKCQDISDSTTKCQDISDSNTKCQCGYNTKCQDISKCPDSINSTKYPDSGSQDSCSKCPDDSDNTCLGAAARCSACCDQNCKTQQTGADHSGSVTPSLPVLSEFCSPSPDASSTTQDQGLNQAGVSSKKRLINGVLVNDRSYSTRL